ncbi:hypothetical protein ACFQ7B_22525 [Streptomyces erythrochromogenes]|uniref:hypothetical protein n=1 Tax=Streptomyces erythrochromogenes TaxID=285574 RepID=UPI0036746FE0
MRGKQLKVYLHPDDHAAVQAYVHDKLSSLVLQERARNPERLQIADVKEGGVGRLICHPSLTGSLRPRHVEVTGEWVLDIQSNPVVEWWFSRVVENVLYPGRFYYMPASAYPQFDGGGRLGEFSDMADRLFCWVRSWAVKYEAEWGVEMVGPATAELLRNGDIALRRNPPGSRL